MASFDPAALDAVRVYALPMRNRFRGITVRRGVLLSGPAGWGEFCPFEDYDDAAAVPWLQAAFEACEEGWPEPVRDRIPVNCTVPAVPAETAAQIVARSGCRTAKVKIAEPGQSAADDLARVEAVRDALGPGGAIRVDANAAWDVDTAVSRLRELDGAAGGLEYAEQPCPSIEELAAVRRRVEVRIAADESIRRAEDPMRVAVAGAADVAIIKATPLGGVRRALQVAEASGLPCVVSSAVETSVGLSAQLALAGALPELPFACGLGTVALLEGDVVAEPLLPEQGFLPVPSTPPEPDPARVAAATPPADVQRWWLDRMARVGKLLRPRGPWLRAPR
ncbi:O-succinylbenzoate synthase [Saccharopolyspora rhizosphaerae]|uniref:o-succinylbenzoate synthase n=1 Tax=Saccharopolyspora rhizosphaerae TaxID=2492662 RepID=A0A426JVX6_9PSEU|nr:o-succinylbenzoate synthase [Saccharopolyspora rhizosphaerae]RRO17335.1 O-succinylbenzoate synthase [Saccharopolyspora rhizosphaerae]